MLLRKPKMLTTIALARWLAPWGALLVKDGIYRAPAAVAKLIAGREGLGRAEGKHGANSRRDGVGQPELSTVLRARFG